MLLMGFSPEGVLSGFLFPLILFIPSTCHRLPDGPAQQAEARKRDNLNISMLDDTTFDSGIKQVNGGGHTGLRNRVTPGCLVRS